MGILTEKISGPAVSPGGGMVTGQIDTCTTSRVTSKLVNISLVYNAKYVHCMISHHPCCYVVKVSLLMMPLAPSGPLYPLTKSLVYKAPEILIDFNTNIYIKFHDIMVSKIWISWNNAGIT